MKSYIASIALLSALTASSAIPPLNEVTPSKSELFKDITLTVGAGYNPTIRDALQFAAVNISLAPSLSLGVVGARDNWGWQAGALTLNVTGSVILPVIGKLNLIAGDGPGCDFGYPSRSGRTAKLMNYLFVGIQRPIHLKRFTLTPGFEVVNETTRPGTFYCGSVSWRF